MELGVCFGRSDPGRLSNPVPAERPLRINEDRQDRGSRLTSEKCNGGGSNDRSHVRQEHPGADNDYRFGN